MGSGDSEGFILPMFHLCDADTSSVAFGYERRFSSRECRTCIVPALAHSDNRFAMESFAPIGGDSREVSRDCDPPETVSE